MAKILQPVVFFFFFLSFPCKIEPSELKQVKRRGGVCVCWDITFEEYVEGKNTDRRYFSSIFHYISDAHLTNTSTVHV